MDGRQTEMFSKKFESLLPLKIHIVHISQLFEAHFFCVNGLPDIKAMDTEGLVNSFKGETIL